MGVIKRQGIKQSLVTYVGVFLGLVSTLWIYPLNLEIYGFLQLILAIATVLIPFASLGFAQVSVKFYPEFEKEGTKHGFFGFLITSQIIWYLFFLIILYFVKDNVIEGLAYLNFDKKLIEENELAIVILCFLQLGIVLTTLYISNFNRIVVPALLNNVWVRFAIPILVILFYLQWASKEMVVWMFHGIFLVVVVGNLVYLKHLKQLKFNINIKPLTKERLKRIGDYSLFSMLNSLGGKIALRIDIIMVGMLLGVKEAGIYSLMLFISNVIEIPYKSIKVIATPIISKSWDNGDLKEIRKIYIKASRNLFFVGSMIFLLIWGSLTEVLTFTTRFEELRVGVDVVFFLGLSKMVDMILGVNTQIIAMSKSYRFNLVSLLILAVLNLYLNYWLIPIYGITGAAMATLFSLCVFNISTFLFLLISYKLTPFSMSTVKILLLFLVGMIALVLLPEFSSVRDQSILTAFLGGGIKTIIILLIYAIGLFYLNVSNDLKAVVKQVLRKFF